MQRRELEEIVDREFRRLPLPRAPETLLPRVMAAVQAWTRRPWYARAWLTWPLWLQAGSAAVFALLIAGVAAIWPAAQGAALDIISGPAGEIVSRVAVPLRAAEMAAHGMRVLWRALLEPLVQYVFVVVVLMCGACAAFGAAIGRLAIAAHAHR